MRKNQSEVVKHQMSVAWLEPCQVANSFPGGSEAAQQRGLASIVWSDSLSELQWKIAFRCCCKNVKPHSQVGHNLHKEANSALRIKFYSVITWDLQKTIVLPSSWVYGVCHADNESIRTHLGYEECSFILRNNNKIFLKEFYILHH